MNALFKTFGLPLLVGFLWSNRAAEPLVIQSQGSFSAGGAVATAAGKFDAKKPLLLPVKRTMAITRMCFIRSRLIRINIPS